MWLDRSSSLLTDDGMQKEHKYLRHCSQGFKVTAVELNFPKAAEAWNHGMSSGITTAGCFLTHVVRQIYLVISHNPTYCLLKTTGKTTNSPRIFLNKEQLPKQNECFFMYLACEILPSQVTANSLNFFKEIMKTPVYI